MVHIPVRRPDAIDRGPKVTLAEAADRLKVDVNHLRRLVAVRKLKPVLVANHPRRQYYSLLRVKEMLLLERRGPTN